MSEATPTTEQIQRELASLGEAPLTEAELALIHDQAEQADAASGHLDHDPDIASVARLAELAEPIEFEDLSQLELHRAWRGVEQRLSGPAASPKTGGGGRAWLFAAVGVAAAAIVLLIVLQPDRDSQQARAPSNHLDHEMAELAELGDQARAALRVLDDGQTDTERATQLATAYQRRLAQREEQGG
jgi:hypothetical protein